MPNSKIQWTEKQKQVANLLKQGSANKDVAAELGVAPSLVSKVAKALSNGFVPPLVSHNGQTATSQHGSYAFHPEKQAMVESAAATQAWSAQPAQGQQQNQAHQQSQPLGDATVMKLVPITAVVPLTPIMQNARSYLIQGLGWPADTKWEDIIDTIIYKYFISLDPPVVLQGWYIDDAKKQSKPR